MVKRYNPTAKIQSSMAPYGEEAVVIIEQCSDGEFVKYEAYRLLEKKYAKLFYGNECVKIASFLKIPYKKLQETVLDYCLDHYKHFECYPMDMTIDDKIVVSFEAIMEILEYSERNDGEKVIKIKKEKDNIF